MRFALFPLALVALVLTSCDGSGSTAADESTSEAATSTVATTSTLATPRPAPFTVEGRGPTTRSISVPNDYRPVIIIARYPKRSFLTVQLRGKGFDRSKDESGALLFSGSPASFDAEPGIASGEYELSVTQVKGPWSLQFAVPDPSASAFSMLEQPIVGTDDNIGKVHLSKESELRWEMQSDAPMMTAKLVGYGDAQGTEQFLGIVQGDLGFAPGAHGFRSDAAMPAGDYLLVVDADGRWVVTFSPAQ